MATEIVNSYKNLVNNIGQLIEVSGYRNDYIAQKIGLTPVNFATKKKRGTLSVTEIEQIISIIENEDVEDYIMIEIMKSRKDEPTISLEQLEKEMGWK
ncbi:hypothetical protein [Dyadobacter frigoris]|uniref:DUF739 family protein n=1 Tax=Dyadobacter frigoris TaxID=2576211 RepID=A0A4U6CYB4_9BACT|nr:hypothetical protein [Dyadobacter frigoris]TKT88731.1 hypothetical protein FDK13_25855 [Dyadobacter frigoris]GLU53923.1 hypothetical protein Dfri01_33840 [Dyadobacter frigoris]